MQTVLSHLAPTPTVQQVGRALYESDTLLHFATTLVDQPGSLWIKSLEKLAKPCRIDLSKQLSRRAVTEFPLSYTESHPVFEVIRTLLSRVDRDQRLTDMVFHWERDRFDTWVAQSMPEDCQAVYSYEYTCLKTFRSAQARGIARIYDVPSPEHDFVENLLESEFSQYPEIQTPYRRYCRVRQPERTAYRRQEWQLADVVIANSAFTKKSYVAAGVPEEKIYVVPCGAPPVCQSATAEYSRDSSAPTSFLWAGTFSVRKGAHYLLDAWQKLNPGKAAKLQILGAMGLPESLLRNMPDSISISGTVPRSELYPIYQQADVLVFPTLCDGFGMVVTEAFAHGLPVITTDRAGAADLVEHGVNGLIVPAGDADAIAEAMDWCIMHPVELKQMRKAALATAAKWQWSDYRHSLIQSLNEGLQQAGYAWS
ncbi:MAG: glycosyltransferase family 4 protein [Phormidesmis sp.]